MEDQKSIEITNLSKKYGYVHVLREVSFDVYQGEVFGLLGPNGSGKTTLLKILATLISPTNGDVRVNGLETKKNEQRIRQMIGYLAHDSLLYRDLSGEENINYYAKFYSFPSHEDVHIRIEKALNLLRVSRWRYEPIKNLSSGLRKRFDLVRAILHDPQILLLDEPFTGLDMNSVDVLQRFIQEVKGFKTVVLSTHDIRLAQQLCDRIAVLLEGRVHQVVNGPDTSITDLKEIFMNTAK